LKHKLPLGHNIPSISAHRKERLGNGMPVTRVLSGTNVLSQYQPIENSSNIELVEKSLQTGLYLLPTQIAEDRLYHHKSPIKNCAFPSPKLQSSLVFAEQVIIRSFPITPQSSSKLLCNSTFTVSFSSTSRPCRGIWTKTSLLLRVKLKFVSSQVTS
jgi:hypothetical protein